MSHHLSSLPDHNQQRRSYQRGISINRDQTGNFRIELTITRLILLVTLYIICLLPLQVSATTSTWKTFLEISGGSSTATVPPTTTTTTSTSSSKTSPVASIEKTSLMGIVGTHENDDLLVVFSDLDGTLIHYPEKPPKGEPGNQILKLPPSSTGMRGIISSKTLTTVQDIRRKNVKFVVVSGMRTSTFLSRLPYLPRADAYATEAGGRIFYPIDDYIPERSNNNDVYEIKPQKYDGAEKEDLKAFGIVEDLEWRRKMEKQAGDFNSPSLQDLATSPNKLPDLNQRDGLLWDFARDLISKGFVLDMKGYSACFRVNKKQQTSVTDEEFEKLMHTQPWPGLATSVNLSCIDFYPELSGKKNCCQYLAEKFIPNQKKSELLTKHAVCICDDDNDLQMALACGHAYIPEISSTSMADVISAHPEHFTRTGGEGLYNVGPAASEMALSLILSRLESEQAEIVETNE